MFSQVSNSTHLDEVLANLDQLLHGIPQHFHLNMKTHTLIELHVSLSLSSRDVMNLSETLASIQNLGDEFELFARGHVAVAGNAAIGDNLPTVTVVLLACTLHY